MLLRRHPGAWFLLRLLIGALLALPLGACVQTPTGWQFAGSDARRSTPDGDGALREGRELLRLGEFSDAKNSFISAINLGAPHAEALSGIGLAEEGLGHLAIARNFFERVIRIEPNSVNAHNNLGVVLFRQGQFHEAQQAFQKAYALSSGTSEISQHNLRLANLAVAEIDANEAGIVVGHRLLRRGESEYLLTPTAVTLDDDPLPAPPRDDPAGEETEETGDTATAPDAPATPPDADADEGARAEAEPEGDDAS